MDWTNFRFIDLFAGIGGIRLGFESAGGHCVFSSEWDADACKTYEANFGEMPEGDITKISASDIPDFDVLLAGFPCQTFSIMGKKEGFADETRGTLFFDIVRILKEKQPKAFLLENVRNLTAHDKGRTFKIMVSTLEGLGYKVHAKVLNALDFGVPQKRERIIIVGFLEDVEFEFPEPVSIEDRKTLDDILEKKVDAKYYVKPNIRDSRIERLKDKNYPKPYISHENMAGSITPHPYSSALRAGASANYILINDERRPTERELLRIQGFPEDYKVVVSYSKIKKQTGNSVAVPVIKAVAKNMIEALKKNEGEKMAIRQAKAALDDVIKKSRVHLYKPIQIAEILYRDRVVQDIDLSDIETYRNKSKKWRDDMTIPLVGAKSTSSAKYQDDIFNAIPPELIVEMGKYNREHNGAIEAYVYRSFINKHAQLKEALDYCINATKESFDVRHLINSFWEQQGLKRSIDKVYEIVVYALFSTLVNALELSVEISISENKLDILEEFSDFTEKVMCLDFMHHSYTQNARVYRVGVTNAADRGLDMYSNWGPAIQIKHLSLDEDLAEMIVGSVSSEKVVIVCKEAERRVIVSLLTQIGWRNRIQSIVTEADLVAWYEKALRGQYADVMSEDLLSALCAEIAEEFPSVDEVPAVLKDRHYELVADDLWT